MVAVYLGLGSNIRPREHLQRALQGLMRLYGPLRCSPVYESEAVGFDGDNFLNMVTIIECERPLSVIAAEIRQLELDNGRERQSERFSARTLDIDLLLYGDEVVNEPGLALPRDEIRHYAFVLKPLFDVAPTLRLPDNGDTVRELWQAFDAASQPLRVVEFEIPPAA